MSVAIRKRRFKPYPVYKDSGVEWLGEIPVGWDAKPLKALLSSNAGGVWGEDFDDEGVTVLRSTEQTVNGSWAIENPARRRLSVREAAAARLEVGDLVVTKSSGSELHIGKTTIVDQPIADLQCCFSNFMQRLRISLPNEPRFFWYLLNSPVAREQLIFLSSTTTGLGNLNGSILGSIRVGIASDTEQRAIATFLDREAASIDALLAKKERLIELLQEKRTALITRAVTKGLDPSVPMKDSDVEWLDRYPAHWTGLPLKRWVATKITDGPHETPELVPDGVDFVSAEAVSNGRIDFDKRRGFISPDLHAYYCRKCRPIRDDILICKSGATTGKLARVDVDAEFSVWSPLALVRSKQSRILPRFLEMALSSDYVQKQIKRTWSAGTQPNISMGDLEQLFVVAPRIEEQAKILNYVNQESRSFDPLASQAREAIARLKELRTALISAAVTGKIDVRKEAA